MTALLRVEGLSKSFSLAGRRREVVRGVDLTVHAGRHLGLVGESGSGKTTLALCCLYLLRPDAGNVAFAGQDLSRLSAPDLRRLRCHMQMVFQDSLEALDPRLTLGQALAEPLHIHQIVGGAQIASRTADLLAEVGLAAGLRTRYPHEISGGQRQRLGIARALATEPQLLILDEPVSALDVSVRAQILDLLDDLGKRRDLTMVFISHDLSTVSQVADHMAVMFEGRIVEEGSTRRLGQEPSHPYSVDLFAAIPRPDPRHRRRRVGGAEAAADLAVAYRVSSDIDGSPPIASAAEGRGCPYLSRCTRAARLAPREVDICRLERPLLRPLLDGGGEPMEGERVACHYPTVRGDLISG